MLEEPHAESPPAADHGDLASSAHAEWTERQLPPVKPPTPGLLVQLFFIPMIIVGIIVSVWLMFGWLAQSGARPEELAADLEQLNTGSWQKALQLSQMLRSPRNDELRSDKALANRLAAILEAQLQEQAPSGSEQQLLKIWLCQALCHFDIDAGMPALIKASSASQDIEIRRAAIQGIGLLADGLADDVTVSHPDLVTNLQDAASVRTDVLEDEVGYGQLRCSTAFTLGIVGGTQALDTLAAMLSDPYPDARYNAATGLARYGDKRAVPRLREMIKLGNANAVASEKLGSESERAWKQDLVIKNGLQAIRQLYTINRGPPDEGLLLSIDELKESGTLKGATAVELKETLNVLERRR